MHVLRGFVIGAGVLCREDRVERTSGETEALLADRQLLSEGELWRREPRAEPELLKE